MKYFRPEVIAEVRRLLAEGELSQREIRERTNVSRGTITAISMGRYVERRPADIEPESECGPVSRCRTCGGMVEMPCRLCHVRVLKYGLPADARS